MENECGFKYGYKLPPMGGRGYVHKNVGTLGTVGILEGFLGEFGRFSRVPKDANGTLETNVEVGMRNAEVKTEVRGQETGTGSWAWGEYSGAGGINRRDRRGRGEGRRRDGSRCGAVIDADLR